MSTLPHSRGLYIEGKNKPSEMEVILMLKHQIEINVLTDDKLKNVIKSSELTLRNRILTALFGKEQRILVLVPADSVQSVAIKEVEAEVMTNG